MSFLDRFRQPVKTPITLSNFWTVVKVSDDGFLHAPEKNGMMFSVEGVDGSFVSPERMESLHNEWRSLLRFSPGEELQIVFRKRVDFLEWIEEQLGQAFLSDNAYGKRILLDRLADQVSQMGGEQPTVLSQDIVVCFWTEEKLDENSLRQKRALLRSQLSSFGFRVQSLDRAGIEREIFVSSQDLNASKIQEPEWPALAIEADQVKINRDRFRAIELIKLPENATELGMIQALTGLPYPMDISVRLKARDMRPIVSRLEKKRNLLVAQKRSKSGFSAALESQIDQIHHVLRSLADRSESIFDMQVVAGLRLPETQSAFQRKAVADMCRAGAKMDFSDFEECTLQTFDAYLECIPGFSGSNLRHHTVLGSNAVHFLPFFRPARGDKKPVVTFKTRNSSLYGIDPADSRLANYNWLVSGTSGAGKSFFVNSLLAQTSSMDPNIFIVDIGGSYNKLTQFLGGRVMSLEPGQGFELSPFFLPKSEDQNEERTRRQHIFQIFLEMTRVDGALPPIEIRHLLFEELTELFNLNSLPEHPITHLIERLQRQQSGDARRLVLLLQPWGQEGFFGRFLDNNIVSEIGDRVMTFDLKGLTEFEDLSRVIQLIVCSSLWARIRRTGQKRFSWIVLDEVAFSLLKTQSEFVDELVSTLRKHYAGAVIVVQDLEKITSNSAGASILQNTQSKAILQQRGDPRHYAEALALTDLDQWAIESLRREKGSFSEIFLIRDNEKSVVRHVPSRLEYWLGTTAPEDNREFKSATENSQDRFQKTVLDFVRLREKMR